ncbi:MAG: nitrous oxide-stimulated promoter family protein [Candidatus Kapabacteria bacterium]|nr:nitrous oxide-stimulated promoter family protein [Candidatus Kapabacteria bacterium]
MSLFLNRIERERLTVKKMIELYCKLNHTHNGSLCSDCQSLSDYAMKRLDNCPYDDNDKPTCKNCTIHCYRKYEKEKIREIMRFSGPKMLLHHPYLAIMHLIDNKKTSNQQQD